MIISPHYRIALNKRRGKKDNFTPNREIMIYICIGLGISYVSCEVSNVFIHLYMIDPQFFT